MKLKKTIILVVMGIIMLHFLSGCSPNRAKIRIERELTFKDIVNNWDKYDIYYAGSSSRPIAILIDPKNDDVKLVGDRWIRVEDKKTLSSLAEAIQNGTFLNKIISRKDGSLLGYYSRTRYTETSSSYATRGYNPLAKMVDEHTVNVNLVRYELLTPTENY